MRTMTDAQATRPSDCILCSLVDGLENRSVVYEDAACLALMTIEPVNPGHVMDVPRMHVALVSELDDDLWLHVSAVAKRVEAAIRTSGVRCEGTNMFLADGEAAFQEVPHVHLHVLPRFLGDNFRIEADWSQSPSRDDLDRTASLIADALRPASGG